MLHGYSPPISDRKTLESVASLPVLKAAGCFSLAIKKKKEKEKKKKANIKLKDQRYFAKK